MKNQPPTQTEFDPYNYSRSRLLRWRSRFQEKKSLLIKPGRDISNIALQGYSQVILVDPDLEHPGLSVDKEKLIIFTSVRSLEKFKPLNEKFSKTLKFICSKTIDKSYPQTPWNYYFWNTDFKDLEKNQISQNAIANLWLWLGIPEVHGIPEIIFYPAFATDDDLQFHLTRISWYLKCIPNRKIRIFAAQLPKQLKQEKFYDPACLEAYQQLIQSGILECESPENLDTHVLDSADIVISWKPSSEKNKSLGVSGYEDLIKSGKRIYCVDPMQRMESSKYINISMDTVSLQPGVVAENLKKFQQFSKKIGNFENAYLFATGPSSSAYTNYNYQRDNSLRIICNSIITDAEMLYATQPQILVFADPIFHFGCSSYASVFRQQLLEASEVYDFTILIPIKHYALFCYHMPQLTERTIGIPFRSDGDLNTNLKNNFYIRSFDNILTFMMLPLAATFADNLFLIGCDGRPLEESNYFWTHNKKAQINSEMHTIQQAHPSFFKTDYNEYYLRHCENVELWARVLESENKTIKSLWPSFIPALKERSGISPYVVGNKINILIEPDLKNKSGLLKLKAPSGLCIVLCSQSFNSNPQSIYCVPIFNASLAEISRRYQSLYCDELTSVFSSVLKSLFSGLNQQPEIIVRVPDKGGCLIDAFSRACNQQSVPVLFSQQQVRK